MDSILTSVKKILGITEDNEQFDVDIIMHINSVLMILSQLGVGPEEGFQIEDKDDLWSDFIPENFQNFAAVKSYVSLKVKLLFDPPLSSTVIESMNKMIAEYEVRLNIAGESKESQ